MFYFQWHCDSYRLELIDALDLLLVLRVNGFDLSWNVDVHFIAAYNLASGCIASGVAVA